MQKINNKNIDAVILCGGLGMRLRKIVSDRPKPMVQVNNQPFLDILIRYLFNAGFRRFILCTGHMADNIKRHFFERKDLHIAFCQEKALLGTGGAVKKARRLIKSNPFLVVNGDSFCRIDLQKFLEFHRKKNAIASVVLAKNKGNRECGSVKLQPANRISVFSEKAGLRNKGLVNAGIYLFQKEIFSLMPKESKFSLEYDLFPLLADKEFYGYLSSSILLDIGTPEGLKWSRTYFKRFKLFNGEDYKSDA